MGYPSAGRGAVKVTSGPEGSFAEYTPYQSGAVKLRIVVDFTDGGSDIATVWVNVIPPQRDLEMLDVHDDALPNGLIPIQLGVSNGKSTVLGIWATYSGSTARLYIPPRDVAFHLQFEGSDPPIQLDNATGKITSLHTGDALVETTCAGKTVDTCVTVILDQKLSHRFSHCESLLQAKAGAPQ
jgi:hypothetical protein